MVVCSKNLYELLGVSFGATKDEIKLAYKKMVRIYHPDLNKEKDAEVKFKLLNNAYDVLSDDEKRKNYDELLKITKGKNSFKNKRLDKNAIIKEVKITEIEAKEGAIRTVNILNTQTCPKCMGKKLFYGLECSFCKGEGEKKELKKVEVEIHKNVQNNELIYVGKVNSSALYDKNLFLKILIEPVKKLCFSGEEVFIQVEIPLYDAILGTVEEINIENYGLYKMKIPPLTQNGAKIKLDLGKSECFAKIEVVFPKELSKEEIKLFRNLKNLSQPREKGEFGE